MAIAHPWCTCECLYGSFTLDQFEKALNIGSLCLVHAFFGAVGTWFNVQCAPTFSAAMVDQLEKALWSCRSLLLSPTWLENKTHWHGPVAVSKDFYAAASANTDLASLCSLLMQVCVLYYSATKMVLLFPEVVIFVQGLFRLTLRVYGYL